MNFSEQYGPWGIVAGASEGLGAEFAAQLAAQGLHLILIARRLELLQALAAQLSAAFGIRTKCIELDLSEPDAAEEVVRQTMDQEVGLLVYNAAASIVGPFLEQSMDDHMKQLHTNIHAPFKLVYLFSQHFLERGHGGILLMSSLSAYQGSAYITTYAATKAFNIILAEGLWEEWRGLGVDVLVCVAGAIKTPNLVASQPGKTNGLGDMTLAPVQVVREALDALGKQPYVIPGRTNRVASFVMRHLLPRKVAIKFMGNTLRKMYLRSS
ncbi:MAG: SDR family NAD(P)-dependent oxidoreductase [Bacteroidota bacterium]